MGTPSWTSTAPTWPPTMPRSPPNSSSSRPRWGREGWWRGGDRAHLFFLVRPLAPASPPPRTQVITLLDEEARVLAASLIGADPAAVSVSCKPFNLPAARPIRDLNPADVNQLVSVRGMLTRASSIIPDLRVACFRCEACGAEEHTFNDRGRVEEPTTCAACGARFVARLLHNRCGFFDKQIVKMQAREGGGRGWRRCAAGAERDAPPAAPPPPTGGARRHPRGRDPALGHPARLRRGRRRGAAGGPGDGDGRVQGRAAARQPARVDPARRVPRPHRRRARRGRRRRRRRGAAGRGGRVGRGGRRARGRARRARRRARPLRPPRGLGRALHLASGRRQKGRPLPTLRRRAQGRRRARRRGRRVARRGRARRRRVGRRARRGQHPAGGRPRREQVPTAGLRAQAGAARHLHVGARVVGGRPDGVRDERPRDAGDGA